MASSELAAPPGAVWIGSDHAFDLHEAYLDFRRAFALEHAPGSAWLSITADSRYRLWVNGQLIARGPARCWPHAQSVDALDLAPRLQAGRNLLAVQVYQPGYSHFAYVHRGMAGLLAWLEVNGAPLLVTDTSWRVRRNPAFNPLVRRVSIYGSGVEDRDLSLDEAWPAPAYDDARWAAPRVVAPAGGYPWLSLRPRDTPLLNEREQTLRLLETRLGPAVAEADPHLSLRAGWPGAAPTALTPDAAGWFVVDLPAGQAAYWLFDLGRDYHCQGWAEVEGAAGGETLLVSYAERIRAGQLVLSDPATYCRLRLTDRFRLRAGAQTAETFALRGGRYLLFHVSGPGRRRVRFHARVAEYPLAVTRPLAPADPALARIAAMCQATLTACLSDTCVDSVWRESSQWVGDALPQALSLAALTDDVRPLRRVLVMAAEGAYPDGVLPSVLPGEAHAYAIVDYNFTWVELLALYHRLAGDAALLSALWPALVRLLERFQQDVAADGLIRSQPGRRLFLDWAPLSRAEPSAVYNLHYLLALQTAARLAANLGRAPEPWPARADALRAACRAAFWDGSVWSDDPAGATFSQLAAALAVLTGAAEPQEAPALLDAIAARSLDDSDEPAAGRMVLASPFMHHYLFEALRAAGRGDAVVEIIRRRWSRWVMAGSPTTWENWNVDFPDGSQCHAFSAHPLHHLAEIARGSASGGRRDAGAQR